MNHLKIREHLQQFLLEDIGDRDITTETIFPEGLQGEGEFIAKEEGILSGSQIIKEVYHLLDPSIDITVDIMDGDVLQKGDRIATVSGNVRSILSGERIILNLMQRMSGIATMTNEAVKELNSPKTKICDTRKTTPGLRTFEKYAVTCGGGYNHRFGLYDGVMIKDNHIAFCGSITTAVQKVRQQLGHMVKIEVETESKQQVLEAVEAGADVIMLDNRTPEEVFEMVQLIPGTIISEASGNISLETISQYRECNVDYISMGSLTHSTKSLDISFNVKNQGGEK
ncbi:carboxylating nicotinate-nucleotide diphosphorylase [Aquibacillus albus]|uniref:nicotinate-nucleotide diphosphorylase (carboxylating) n=1 Tax=Aquibacillus albus TaxID=1168171 RepID=A0ABS2N1M9_9BACI|nr:carboxylating nicotinate-nucleotide diphosphorylase [Aquibacillus albus]MBM7572046.1 nicotinate-nucleotide pyrophosphorylase (carboxylating) [Aquibacillus albus]